MRWKLFGFVFVMILMSGWWRGPITPRPGGVDIAPTVVVQSAGTHPKCYHNRSGQLVCQECREVNGKVQCGKARIVRQ